MLSFFFPLIHSFKGVLYNAQVFVDLPAFSAVVFFFSRFAFVFERQSVGKRGRDRKTFHSLCHCPNRHSVWCEPGHRQEPGSTLQVTKVSFSQWVNRELHPKQSGHALNGVCMRCCHHRHWCVTTPAPLLLIPTFISLFPGNGTDISLFFSLKMC